MQPRLRIQKKANIIKADKINKAARNDNAADRAGPVSKPRRRAGQHTASYPKRLDFITRPSYTMWS